MDIPLLFQYYPKFLNIRERVLFFWIKPSVSGKLVIVGALLAGVNLISLYGGIKINKMNSKF